MRLRKLIFLGSVCLNLMAVGAFGYFVHHRGGVKWLAARVGFPEKQTRRIDRVAPEKDGFLRLVSQLQQQRVELFNAAGCLAFVILPRNVIQTNTPWVWYAPTLLPKYPSQVNAWLFEKLLDAGIPVAGIDVGESYGSPEGVRKYNDFHEFLGREFSSQTCLLAQSRGGLMLYNWASQKPQYVKCIVGIYPVCDLRSYPGLTSLWCRNPPTL